MMTPSTAVKTCVMTAVVGFLAFFAQSSDLVSQKGYEFILGYEGCKIESYHCSAGVDTIGIGHTTTTVPNQTITEEVAVLLFREDVESRAKKVDEMVTVSLPQHQFDMLVSFSFNVGINNLKKSTMLKYVNRNELLLACHEFKRWTYVNGKQCKDRKNNCYGIVLRRDKEKEICLNGYP